MVPLAKCVVDVHPTIEPCPAEVNIKNAFSEHAEQLRAVVLANSEHTAAFLPRVQHSRTLRRFEDVFNQGTIIPRRAIQVLSDQSAVPSPDETRGQIRPPLYPILPRSYPNNDRNNFRYTLGGGPPRMYNGCVREMQLRYPVFRITLNVLASD